MAKHIKGLRHRLAAGICAGAVFGMAAASNGLAGAPAANYHFAIPSEDMGAALRAYAAATGSQVLFDSQVVHGAVSAALNGSFTPADGLNHLLAGSHLAWRRTDAGVVLISAQVQAPPAPRPKPSREPDTPATEVVVRGITRQRPADNTPPPLEVYAALPKYEQMTLSPDGTGIAFLTTYEGAHYLVTFDLATRTKRAVKLSAGEVSSIAWVDKDHVLVNTARTGLRGTCGATAPGGSENIPIVSVSVSGGRNQPKASGNPANDIVGGTSLAVMDVPRCVYFGVRSQNAITSVNLAETSGVSLGEHLSENANLPLGLPEVVVHDGKPRLAGALLELRDHPITQQPTERVYLWDIDPQTGQGRRIDDGGGDIDREHVYVDDWLLDHAGRPIARTVYDYDHERFSVEIPAGAGWKAALTRPIWQATHTVAPFLAGLGRGEGTILVVDAAPGDADKAGLRTFHYYELSADGKLSGPLEPGDAAQDRPVFDPRTGHLAGFVQSGESDVYSLDDPTLRSLYQRAQAVVPGESVRIVATARDPRKMIIHAQGGEDPGSYYVIDFATGVSTPIGDDYALLPSEWVASQSLFGYKASDGLDIQALVTLPPKPEAKNLPLVVLPHDGPAGHDRLGFDWLAQALASRGYLVLQPDYRGSDGHGADFAATGYGQWGRKMQSDLSDGVRELVAQGMADPKRVCIVGMGYGGYAAVNGATDAGTYRCAISINGITDPTAYKAWQADHRAIAEQDAITPLVPDPAWPRAFKVNPDSSRMLDAYLGSGAPSPAAVAMTVPVLLVHERDDPVVPIQQSQGLRDAMQAAGHPAEWVEVPGQDHVAGSEAARAAILHAVVTFLEKQNPGN